jgi:hypothetical protein
MANVSLSKSLRTPKVSLDPGPVAQTFRYFDSNPTKDIPQYMVDIYNRPAAIDAGNVFLGPGCPGCFSPEYRIMNENAVSRPQYSEYLNVPQGLQMVQSEYPNRPKTDTLGRYRDRAFGIDGTFQRMAYPANAQNAGSDKDWMLQQAWFNNKLVNQFDNRNWVNSADTTAGF